MAATRMMSFCRTVAVFGALAVAAAPASAQDRLIERNRWLGAHGQFGQDLGPAPDIADVSFIGGDEYGVKDGVAYHLLTGAAGHLGAGRPVAFDGARPRVFMLRADGIWQAVVKPIAPGALAVSASLYSGGPTSDLRECRHAASADVLVCAAERSDGAYDLVRLDPAGRHLLFTDNVSVNPGGWWSLVLTPDAARIYYLRCLTPGCSTRDVALFDVVTGAISNAGIPDFVHLFAGGGVLTWDEVNERLFVEAGGSFAVLARDLAPVGRASIGGRCRNLAISPHTGRLYVNKMDYYYSPEWSTLSAFDAATYRALEPEAIRSAGFSCGPLKVLTAPGRPRALRATVTGQAVSLTWTNVGNASHFVLEAGVGPGRTDLRVGLGPDAHATFTGVPAGTYYLRIRGGNVHGGGHASDEIRVVVP